jgi:Domain of unknown function (DUF4167)
MRNGQNKRMRGRSNRKGHNPLTRVYESNGPDVKIRGTANHIAEKYVQLARDAQSSGDPVAAENYYQHAEHYYRLIAAAQEQFRQSQPSFYQQQQNPGDQRDDAYDDVDDDAQPSIGGEPGFVPREQLHQREQPYPAREPQPAFVPSRDVQPQSRPQQASAEPRAEAGPELERLPSFITGGAPQQAPQNFGNGHDNQGDRYLHRRRRRHSRGGPRPDGPGGPQPVAADGDETGPGGE